MSHPLIYNERQLQFALTEFSRNRDELDNRARNDDPLDRLDHATYLADKSELRVLLRNRCMRSTIAARTAGKTELVRNLWEAVSQLNVQRFEDELMYQRHNSRPRGPDVDHWLEYHAAIDVQDPQPVLLEAGLETPEIGRAAPVPDPFNGTTPGNFARQDTPAPPPAPAARPPPPTPTGVPGLHLFFPHSATRNPQDQPDQDLHVIPGLDLLAKANRGPPMYLMPPPDRPITPRWFVRVRDRLRNARQEPRGNIHFQAVLERLRRRAGHPPPEPAEHRQPVQPEPQPAEQVQPQPQRRPNRPPVIDRIREGESPLRRILDWSHWLCFWTVCGPLLCLAVLLVSLTFAQWTDLYYDKWLHQHGSCMYVFPR